VHSAYARCMDGHYFLVIDSAHCPLDGSPSDAAAAILRSGLSGARLTLDALASAGMTATDLRAILIMEQADGGDPAEILEPR
jgi:hypothetical protein